MNLWIRSQDKMALVKINSTIGLKFGDRKTIIANYQPNFTDKYDGCYDVLGTYATKERALEVLDEIHKLLIPKPIISTYNVEQAKLLDGTVFIEPMLDDIKMESYTSYVYQMPEE